MMHGVVSLVSLRNCTYFPLLRNFYTKFSHSFQQDQENRACVEHNEIHFVMVSSFLPIFFHQTEKMFVTVFPGLCV